MNSGQKFGRWTVLERDSAERKGIYWHCICDCGVKKSVYAGSLTAGRSTSCGCYINEVRKTSGKKNKTHGLSKSRFYKIYEGMVSRCYKPKTNGYKNYGGRGIKVCDSWHDFHIFIDDMYESYLSHVKQYGESNTTIDRSDSNGNYTKENCKWATVIEQHNNTRNNRMIEISGTSDTLANWCRKYDKNYILVQSRLKIGWDPLQALTKESRKNASL